MPVLSMPAPGDLDCWRPLARMALTASWAPAEITWIDAGQAAAPDLLGTIAAPSAPNAAGTTRPPGPVVPAAFLALAATVLYHRDNRRLGLLYRVLWRLTHGEPQLLQVSSDPDLVSLDAMAKAVRRDSHKMKAFVRFRETEAGCFVAWFEPEHRIVRRVAPFFASRFAGMQWTILTPDDSVHWDGHALHYTPGQTGRPSGEDAREDLWRTYYASIFNPARLNVPMMQKEMPQKYWKHLPEARLIPGLVQHAAQRAGEMLAPRQHGQTVARRRDFPAPAVTEPAAPGTLRALNAALVTCRSCPLWHPATQVVPGSGPADASVVLVGEQPGDREDLAGEPFVGPAGKLLDRALTELAIPRRRLFLTNVVKHFKFAQRGKTRVHLRANAAEQAACRHWLADELALLQPRLIVCLGLTATQALLGPDLSLQAARGRTHQLDGGATVIATLHPATLLRLPAEAFAQHFETWRDELALISSFLEVG